MNIFILDKDIHKSAQYHCDKHVTKMIIETAQIISYAFYRRGITFIGQYKYNQTYINHPCSVWASLSGENIRYLCNLGHQLYNEYCHRYWKQSNDKYSSCKKVFDTGYKRS